MLENCNELKVNCQLKIALLETITGIGILCRSDSLQTSSCAVKEDQELFADDVIGFQIETSISFPFLNTSRILNGQLHTCHHGAIWVTGRWAWLNYMSAILSQLVLIVSERCLRMMKHLNSCCNEDDTNAEVIMDMVMS